MKGISLVSGGLDSTLMVAFLKEEGFSQLPVFIDYGQLAADIEWKTCKSIFRKLNLPLPIKVNFHEFGGIVKSGITDSSKNMVKEAFLPGRNLLFIVIGGSIAVNRDYDFVSIGLLDETYSLFPDQKQQFIASVEKTLYESFDRKIRVLVPLIEFSKMDAIILAQDLGINIDDTYYCHKGERMPCGECISCKERLNAVAKLNEMKKEEI
ncbi:7-cyano-7-deazaguanine synthase [Candidatus Pacearchaeota archaeon]|nr:7-cyano-7-deazaguanine synthase [Candidatus Pacearchaeota archaeon]